MAKTTIKKVNNEDLINKLETEFADLNCKYQHLRVALVKPNFVKTVGAEQYDLLVEQANAMEQYRNILAVRIQLLKNSI